MQYDVANQFGFTDVFVNGTEEYSNVPLVFVDQVGRFSEQAELKQREGESNDAYTAR